MDFPLSPSAGMGKFGEFLAFRSRNFGDSVDLGWEKRGKGFWREFLELVPNFFPPHSQILGVFIRGEKKKLGIIPA